MEKPTTLKGSLPSMGKLGRKLTKHFRDKYAAARAKKAHPPPYVKDAKGGVSGTKYLARSAIYPTRFCTSVADLWAKDYTGNNV